ncbi:MAG TPA: fluoride efflux transporter CrcB [Acidimicrobiales bacterium]|nr:fluoride efflux transporter CrcB [Acidimicrobiales bacterium]
MSGAGWIAFLAAAGLGAPARYLLDGWVQERTGGAFPWGTFAVNVTGCLALGVVTGLALYHDLGATTRAVVGTGGLGAYTTFSTLTYETVRLVEEGAVDDAVRNALGNLLAGGAAAAAGLALTAAA